MGYVMEPASTEQRKLSRSWGSGRWLTQSEPLDRTIGNLHIQTVQVVLAAIKRQRIPEGARMPSTRAIAESLGISRNTAKRAVEILVEQGVLASRDRSGTYLASSAHPEFAEDTSDDSDDIVEWPRRFTLKLNSESEFPDRLDAGRVDVVQAHDDLERQAPIGIERDGLADKVLRRADRGGRLRDIGVGVY